MVTSKGLSTRFKDYLLRVQRWFNRLPRPTTARVLAIGFFLTIFFGAVLLNLPAASANREPIGFFKALFTSTSAVCVTGLVVVETGTAYTMFGQIVILCLIQIGGLGFMSVAAMLFSIMGKRMTMRERLVLQSSLNQDDEGNILKEVRRVFATVFIIEGVGALLLMTRFIPLYGWGKGAYFGIFHSISAFCNAGFDILATGNFESLVQFRGDIIINGTVMLLIIAGGLGFFVYRDILGKRKFRKYTLHSKIALVSTAFLLLAGALLFALCELGNPNTLANPDMTVGEKTLGMMFQSVTTRTAGYATIDQFQLSRASLLVAVLLMFIGANSASTGGGIKTTTAVSVFLLARSAINGQENLHIFRRKVANDLAVRALAIMLISLLAVIFVAGIIMAIEPSDTGANRLTFEGILFEAFSAFGTVGLSTGITPELSVPSQSLLMLLMFMGRVGPLTLTMSLARRQSRGSRDISYAQEKFMVG